MCKFDIFCIGELKPKNPNKACLSCGARKAALDGKIKKPMETPAAFTPCYKRQHGFVPKSAIKMEARYARIIDMPVKAEA